MMAVLVDVPQNVLDERKRLGLDIRDEVWDGVVHVVPTPSHGHQWFAGRLYATLFPLAGAKGLRLYYEFNVFRPDVGERDFRVPDMVAVDRQYVSELAVEGHAALAVEILSPNDETYKKLGFYAEVGIKELLVIGLDTPVIERFALLDGALRLVDPNADGSVRLSSLDVSAAVVDGPAVRLTWDGGSTDITIE